MSGTSAAACVSNRHTGRRWNQWNLFPRNSWSIRKILILNSNQEICLLHRFYGYEVLALFLKCGRKGSTGSTHGGKISVTPPINPKTLTDVNASRVPELGCGWKNLKLRACSNFDVGVVCHIINISPTGRIVHEAEVILFQNELLAPIACYGACHRFACCKQRRFFTKTGYVPRRFGHKVFIFSFKFCGLMPTVDCLEPSGLFSDAQIIVSPTPAGQHQAQYQKKSFHSCQHTKLGSSDKTHPSGYSGPQVLLPTEFLKHLGCKVPYFSSA